MTDPQPPAGGVDPSAELPGGDRIELRGLCVKAVCGVLAFEDRPQPLEIDLDLEADLVTAAASDDLATTIDYGAVCDRVEAVARDETFGLLERLAERLAAVILEDHRVLAVTVSVRKLRPPVPQMLATAGVRVRRRQGSV